MAEFEGLRLSPATVEQLFAHVLVAAAEPPTQAPAKPVPASSSPAPKSAAPKPQEPAPAPALPVLGNGQSRVAVLVNEPMSPVVSDAQKEMLQKIFAAAGQAFDNLLVMNMAAPGRLNYPELISRFSPNKLILFNVQARQMELPFETDQYKVFRHGEAQFLMLPALNNYLGTGPQVQQQKRQLWAALKEMFGL